MAMTNAERAARHKENLKNQGYKPYQVWLDKETQVMLTLLLVTNEELTKEKALQTLLKFGLGLVTGNVTSNDYKVVTSNNERVTSNELTNYVFSQITDSNDNNAVTSNDNISVTSNDNNESLTKNFVTSNENDAVTSNKSVTSNDNISVTSNDNAALIFDLDKSKAIAKALKAQGMTANQIAKELARRGFGNKFGKPFSKSSINKWKL